jgi:hypothetical protein
MEQKNSQTHKFEIKNFKDVYDYCYVNQILDINSFVEKCFKQGFDIKKYGLLGKTGVEEEKRAEIEVIREIRVEVPVEVIKYVDREVIIEVPVEKIVEKVITINEPPNEDEYKEIMSKKDKELDELRRNLDELRQTLDKPIENTDGNKLKMIESTLQNLRKELTLKNKKILELEEINKQLESIKVNSGAVFLKDSNLTQNI